MREKIEAAKRNAKDARDRALLCREKAMQDEWFKVARLWDEVICEMEKLQMPAPPSPPVAANENHTT
jgi:hypothetical protein